MCVFVCVLFLSLLFLHFISHKFSPVYVCRCLYWAFSLFCSISFCLVLFSGTSSLCCGWECGGGQSGQQDGESQAVPMGSGARLVSQTMNSLLDNKVTSSHSCTLALCSKHVRAYTHLLSIILMTLYTFWAEKNVPDSLHCKTVWKENLSIQGMCVCLCVC